MKRASEKILFMIGALIAGLWLETSLAGDGQVKLAMLGQDQNSISQSRPWDQLNPKRLKLHSASALVADRFGNQIYGKQAMQPLPIASITKLMTAMVVLDANLPMDEKITINKQDRDLLRLTGSRLNYGATLSRGELLKLALMSSENRAASALARTFPDGRSAFVRTMNDKAKALGMRQSHFADPAGLDAENISSAADLVKMVRAARQYGPIRAATTTRSTQVRPYRKRGPLKYNNTNRLLKNKAWKIALSKTGYINEAGRCIVMEAEIAGEPMIIVLLNSFGKLTPFGDSNRIRKWIEGRKQDLG